MDDLHVAGEHWSSHHQAARSRWWQHPQIVRHINRTICGRAQQGVVGGDAALMKDRFPAGFRRAVSIGCGDGQKEMALLHTRMVDHFDLYEIAETRVKRGRSIAAEHGFADRITWHQEPADFHAPGKWDLVYWNNALHHMPDVDLAVRWSRRVASNIYVNDFVGPTRMQWSDRQLEIASRVRSSLPERLLGELGATIKRPDPELLAADDPTEAADSGNILPALRKHFPGATVKLTGGVVYHLALNDVLANFTDEDQRLLDLLLLLDEQCVGAGLTHYAVAVS